MKHFRKWGKERHNILERIFKRRCLCMMMRILCARCIMHILNWGVKYSTFTHINIKKGICKRRRISWRVSLYMWTFRFIYFHTFTQTLAKKEINWQVLSAYICPFSLFTRSYMYIYTCIWFLTVHMYILLVGCVFVWLNRKVI